MAALLALFDPPPGVLVLDIGCGVGAVAAMMAEIRPDLRFLLLNVSQAQLDLCPQPAAAKLLGDMHAIPAPDSSVDAVLFCYALGHGLVDVAIAEAARVLRPGGVLFIWDLAAEESGPIIEALGYKAHPPRRVLEAARCAGLVATRIPAMRETWTDEFQAILGAAAYAALFAGVRPIAYRFIKGATHGA